MVTIKDIARECGLHPASVSKALNGSGEISEPTRQRVLAACKRLGYQPNLLARGLIKQQSKMIGLVIPELQNQFYSAVSTGINRRLEENGFGMLLCSCDRDAKREADNIKYLIQAQVDGMIILPTTADMTGYEPLLQKKLPFVFVDNYLVDLDVSFVGNDNYSGARKLVKYLLGRGYRRIGFILSSKSSSASNDRLAAYMRVHEEEGVAVDPDILINSHAVFKDGIELAPILIERKVDCIFAINDTVAMGVQKYCFENHIRIPEDVGLCGYDDIEQASMLPIPLTTIRQNKWELGYRAASLLLERMANPTGYEQKIILQPELIVRQSTK
jgi:DNA-binding LacI/PurR family transcriptional regulator